MEIIFMYVAGIIVFIIAITAVIKGIIHRIENPTNDLKDQISTLQKRVDELENDKKGDS